MKAQSSMEAALLMTFMTLSLVLFLAVAADKISQSYENRDKQQIQDLGLLIETEVKTAAAAQNGYHRTIDLPMSLEGKPYTGELFGPERLKSNPSNPDADHTEIILKFDNNYLPTYEYVIYLGKNVNGTFCYGSNTIVKEKNKVNITCNCPSGYRDNDGDTYTVGNKKIFCSMEALPSGYRPGKSTYEDCDDNDPLVGPCKRVFVTSTKYNGNLGGLNGADLKCQARADAAKINGTYKAWISDSTGEAATRIYNSPVSYVLLDGSYTQIASGWVDLIDGTLSNPISVDENGDSVTSDEVWTATATTGQLKPPQYCNNWATTTDNGRLGKATSTGNDWTEENPESCSSTARLYCFEQ